MLPDDGMKAKVNITDVTYRLRWQVVACGSYTLIYDVLDLYLQYIR